MRSKGLLFPEETAELLPLFSVYIMQQGPLPEAELQDRGPVRADFADRVRQMAAGTEEENKKWVRQYRVS